MELIEQLMSQLGVQEEQAKGGAGLIFQLAKEKLDKDDFARVTAGVPGIDDLIGAAPKTNSVSGLVGGLTSSFGQSAAGLGQLASLASGSYRSGKFGGKSQIALSSGDE